MNLIRYVTIRKPIALCLIILTVLSLTGSSRMVSYAQDEESYQRLAILLNHVRSARYRFSDHQGNAGEIGFRVLAEETVSGEATWKVEMMFSQEGETPEIMNLWISKSTGKCLQTEVGGAIYTGDMAELMGLALLTIWIAWVDVWQEIWNFTDVYGWEETGYGKLTFLGSEIQTLGPSQLLVYKYRWEGYATAPEHFRGAAEYWFAPVSFGTIIVRLYVESDGEWWKIELLSIDLVSPQPRPNIVIDPRIDKTQLTSNEEATISITASNTGNAMGTHNLTITVGGEVKKSWLVVLNPGESKSFSHKLSFAATGSYTVRVGDRTFTITVSTTLPARFDVSGLNINPSSIKVGQSSTISATVKNTGGESGSYTVTLKVNNQAVDTRTGTLSPDQSETVSFTYTPTSEGTYSIDVNGLTGSIAVSREEGPGPAPEIPWLIIIIIVVAVAVVIIVVIFLRRKPAPPPTYAPPTAPPPPP